MMGCPCYGQWRQDSRQVDYLSPVLVGANLGADGLAKGLGQVIGQTCIHKLASSA